MWFLYDFVWQRLVIRGQPGHEDETNQMLFDSYIWLRSMAVAQQVQVFLISLALNSGYSERPSTNFNHYYLIEKDLSQTHHSPLRSQTSHYGAWLLWLTVENWMTIKAKAGKRGTCCSLKLSEMTGQWGEWMVNCHLVCLCTLNWAFGASIINMQLQSLWEYTGEVLGVCVCVLACVAHYSFVSPEWAVAIQSPLCAEREKRREAHLDMRSQIIHLTLRQEGSTKRKRAKLKESEGGEKAAKEKARKTNNATMAGVNREGAGDSGAGRRESASVSKRMGETEGTMKTRARQQLNAIVLPYRDAREVLLPTALQCAAEGLTSWWWP